MKSSDNFLPELIKNYTLLSIISEQTYTQAHSLTPLVKQRSNTPKEKYVNKPYSKNVFGSAESKNSQKAKDNVSNNSQETPKLTESESLKDLSQSSQIVDDFLLEIDQQIASLPSLSGQKCTHH